MHGSLVVDFHDFKILDLDTMVWLPVFCSYPRCRGGIHAIVETARGWLLSGGRETYSTRANYSLTKSLVSPTRFQNPNPNSDPRTLTLHRILTNIVEGTGDLVGE